MAQVNYQDIMDNISDGVYQINADGYFTLVNKAMTDRSGIPRERFYTMHFLDLVDPQYRDLTKLNFQRVMSGESGIPYELMYKDANGQAKYVEVHSGPIVEGDRVVGLMGISRDVTARKQAEKSLEESELRFRLAAESAADLIWEWDIVTGELKWFGPIDELLGYAAGAFPKTIDAWEAIIHQNDHDRVMEQRSRHLKDGTPYFEEYRVLKKDGAILYWADTGRAIRFPETEPSKMVGAVTDITELKLSEKKLKASQKQFRDLLESIPIGVVTIEGTRFGYVNVAFERITGYTRDELRQIDVWDIIHPEFKDEVRQYLQKEHKRLPVPEVFALRIITKSGEERWVERKAIPIKVRERPLILLTAQDITDRKKSEEKLKASEMWFRSFVEALPIGIFSYEGRKFRYVNQSFEKISGYTLDELRLLDVWDIVHPKFKDSIREYVHKRQKGESVPEDLELKIVTKGGEELWLKRVAIPIELGGVSLVLIAAIDITEHKNIKDTLEKLVGKRTSELSDKNERLMMEMKERERVEASLRKKRDELKLRAGELRELNSALKVLLKQRDEDKRDLEDKVMANVSQLVLPYVKELRRGRLDARSKTQVSILETNLTNITSSFTHRLSSKYSGFTPREIQVANLIRQGKSTKEMAEYMRISPSAINLYRNRLRQKLGILSKKINLRSHLMSLS